MAGSVVPEEVMANLRRTEAAIDSLESELKGVLHIPKDELAERLSPLQRAQFYLNLSVAANSLFCLYLATEGISHSDHPIAKELERSSLYSEKVQRAVDKSKGPFRPGASLDIQAVNRFIDHAIPDLSEDQRDKIREMTNKLTSRKRKRKSSVSSDAPKEQTLPVPSLIGDMAKRFLEEAQKEALGEALHASTPPKNDSAEDESHGLTKSDGDQNDVDEQKNGDPENHDGEDDSINEIRVDSKEGTNDDSENKLKGSEKTKKRRKRKSGSNKKR